MTLGVLISGDLGFEVINAIYDHFQIKFILTDSHSYKIIALCKEKDILYYVGNPRAGRLLEKYPSLECDVIVSVNYLFIIESDLINIPKKIAINFHGSLLPKYRGRTPHVWAIINNETKTGITAHRIDVGCDTGDIIKQKIIPISINDTGASILEKYKNEYPDFCIEVLREIESDTFKLSPQNHSIATFFGKRNPEDGQINWSWQKERIFNWVRAQAYPYPGAYTFCNEKKIIINKIKFSDFGFQYKIENGTIVDCSGGVPIVKTPNGCVELIDFDCNFDLQINNQLK